MEFSDWITRKYVEWRGDAVGRERTISDFAEWIGVPQPVMSSWMRRGGKIPSSFTAIKKLINKYGSEVYRVLGFSSGKAEEWAALYEMVPEEYQDEAIRMFRDWLKEKGIR